jgi:hypothetical protein
MKRLVAAAGAGLTAAVVAVPVPAHADDASYQNYLLQHGYGGAIGPAVGPNGPKVSMPGLFVDWPKPSRMVTCSATDCILELDTKICKPSTGRCPIGITSSMPPSRNSAQTR